MKVAQRMIKIPFQPIRKIFEEVGRREKQGENIIHLEIGRPDFDTPAHIKNAAIAALNDGKVHYTSNYGVMELRQAIAKKLQRDNGLTYDPEDEVIVTVGGTEGIFLTIMALLDQGDEILIPVPGFPCYAQCANMAGAVPVSVPLREGNNYELLIEDVKTRITPSTKMIVINTPHNPTGAIYSEGLLKELSKIAVQHDLFVLSDEIYEQNIYDGHRHYSIASFPGMIERTITLNGFSKSYCMTGWRLGYVASSKEIIGAMIRIHQYATVCATSFAQAGAFAALEGPQDEVKAIINEFDRRRKMVIERLENMSGISIVRPKGAFYVFINIAGFKLEAKRVALYLLDKAKVAVVPWGAEHIRISYANSYENLEMAMDNFEKAFAALSIEQAVI